jgi:uncharacterized membrane protein YqjE
MSLKSSIAEYLKIDEIKENFIKLIEAKFELKKLEFQEKAENWISELMVKLILALFLFIIFILLNVFLALVINFYTNSIWIGFTTLMGFYLIMWGVLKSQKQKIKDAVGQRVKESMNKF